LENLNLSRIHLLGIGGAGQNALADLLLDMGYSLSGSDLKLSATTSALVERGVLIFEGQRATNLEDVTLVVTTAAAKADNPELQAARQQGIPVLTNAEMAGALLNSKRLLAVAGTHGKTTTTGLVAFLLEKAGLEPTYYIGGIPRDLGRAGKAGQGELAVLEADEYAARFLSYRPEAALITNIEADHLDYYGTFDVLKEAFVNFVGNISPGGSLFICADSVEALEIAQRVQGPEVVTYGLSVTADWQVLDLMINDQGGYSFNLSLHGQHKGSVALSLPGIHNVRNAVGALAMVIKAAPQIDPQVFFDLAGQYRGASRRFEVKGETPKITVIDDYAHHPTEIEATLAAARARFGKRRLVALFQPHTYSRTKALLDDFAKAFAEADIVALMEIFPARETNKFGISSQDILDKMEHRGKIPATFTHGQARDVLRTMVLRDGDVLLTMGAGDVWKVGEEILKFGIPTRNLEFQ
jgi:UDP-N-acetylmuramate--alanine ligase